MRLPIATATAVVVINFLPCCTHACMLATTYARKLRSSLGRACVRARSAHMLPNGPKHSRSRFEVKTVTCHFGSGRIPVGLNFGGTPNFEHASVCVCVFTIARASAKKTIGTGENKWRSLRGSARVANYLIAQLLQTCARVRNAPSCSFCVCVVLPRSRQHAIGHLRDHTAPSVRRPNILFRFAAPSARHWRTVWPIN